MKKHFQSLFASMHRKRTIFLAALAFLMIVSSQLVGITDNLPGISLLLGGMVCLFFAVLHPWDKSTTYGLLAGFSFSLILLTFLIIYVLAALKMTEYLSEAVVFIIFGLFCIPGIIVGLIGAMYWGFRKK
jgi:hypothetical protein